MNFFTSSNTQDIEKGYETVQIQSSSSTNQQSTSTSTSIFSSIKNIFSKQTQPNQEEDTVKEKLIRLFEVEISYTYFLVMFAIGLFILFISLFFLPYAIIKPQKFVSLFSLGSVIIVISFIFLNGTRNFVSKLFDSGRKVFTILFLVSIFVGIYFSFNETYIIVSHVCALFQLLSLISFVLSFIPGGHLGISFMWGSIKSVFVKS